MPPPCACVFPLMMTVIVSPGVAPVYATFVLKSLPMVRVAVLSGWSGKVTVGLAGASSASSSETRMALRVLPTRTWMTSTVASVPEATSSR